MKGATTSLILGTVLMTLWFLGIPPERPGLGFAFLFAGTILVIMGLLWATLSAVERRRRAKADGAQAPIKMLYPPLSFIFAALISVILSPAIISIMINVRQ